MRERKFIKKCPDSCGKEEYDLGEHRGFHLIQKPFYSGWAIYATRINPDLLDKELLKGQTFENSLFDDTERADHPSLEEIEKNVLVQVDQFWEKREEILKSPLNNLVVCPQCGRKMQLIRKETLPDLHELKLGTDGKPSKMTVTLVSVSWRCDHGGKVSENQETSSSTPDGMD